MKLAHLVGFIMKKIERNSFYVVKVKFALQQATKPERSSSGVALIFNLGARWRWVVNATLWPLYPPRKSRYPLHRKLGWPDGRFGRLRKIAPPPNGIRSPERPFRTELLYRLGYPGPHNVFYSQPDRDPAGSKHIAVKTLYIKK